MPSMVSSHGVAFATAVAVSGTVLLLGFCRQRSPTSAPLAGDERFPSPPLGSGAMNKIPIDTASTEKEVEKRREKRKKRVRFAEQLVEFHVHDAENSPNVEEKLFDAGSLSSHAQPANRMALYGAGAVS